MARVVERLRVDERALAEGVKGVACPLDESDARSYDALIELVGSARIVMIGEASHGTHEFYRERARITTRLMRELDFSFVAIEGDWPEAYDVNVYACGGEGIARETMEAFNVFPTWMWGNVDALHFVEWLRRHNDSLKEGRRKAGFYGLDLYSLYASIDHVVAYLEKVDAEAAQLARRRYSCFDP